MELAGLRLRLGSSPATHEPNDAMPVSRRAGPEPLAPPPGVARRPATWRTPTEHYRFEGPVPGPAWRPAARETPGLREPGLNYRRANPRSRRRAEKVSGADEGSAKVREH